MTTDLKATEVSMRVKDSCRRFWGKCLPTENVANDRLQIKNCTQDNVRV